MKFTVKSIWFQIILTLHSTSYHSNQCMNRIHTFRLQSYPPQDPCIGVISTLIYITVVSTRTQTRDGGEVYKALRNDPETNQLPMILSYFVTSVHVHTQVWIIGTTVSHVSHRDLSHIPVSGCYKSTIDCYPIDDSSKIMIFLAPLTGHSDIQPTRSTRAGHDFMLVPDLLYQVD